MEQDLQDQWLDHLQALCPHRQVAETKKVFTRGWLTEHVGACRISKWHPSRTGHSQVLSTKCVARGLTESCHWAWGQRYRRPLSACSSITRQHCPEATVGGEDSPCCFHHHTTGVRGRSLFPQVFEASFQMLHIPQHLREPGEVSRNYSGASGATVVHCLPGLPGAHRVE